MPKKLSLILAIILSIQLFWAKKDNSSNDPVLGAIVTRGRMLAAYDVAAWHATDAAQAMNPPNDNAQRFIARKTDAGWVVVFGHLNESRDKFLVIYEATQGSTPQEFKAKKCDPPVEDKAFYLAAARALDIALHDFQSEKRPTTRTLCHLKRTSSTYISFLHRRLRRSIRWEGMSVTCSQPTATRCWKSIRCTKRSLNLGIQVTPSPAFIFMC